MSIIEAHTPSEATDQGADEHAVLEKSALGRAQLIIDAFSPDCPVLALTELANRAGLPKSTAHRFAEQMISLGWLERRHSGYRIGIKLYEMGELCERRNNLRRAAATHLVTLCQHTGRSVYLAVSDGDTLLCLDHVASPIVPATRAGRRIRFPLATTVFGQAILAFEPPDEIDRHLELARRCGLDRAEADMVRANLDAVRSDGFVVAVSRRTGIGFMGVPLRNSGRAIASISIAAPREALDERVADLMRYASRSIWNEMFPVTS